MLTFSQKVKRYVPLPIIILWFAIVGIGIAVTGYNPETDDFNLFTVIGILATIYFGVKQITSNEKYYDLEEFRRDATAAPENARLYNSDSGFFVHKTHDNNYNVIVAWKTVPRYPISLNLATSSSFNNRTNCYFCIYYRVFPISQDVDKVIFGGDGCKNKNPDLFWWDYYTIISRIDGNYYGRLTSYYNPKRKNAAQLKNMNDTDFIYAKQAIGEIHTFGYNKIRDYTNLGNSYNVGSLPADVEI